MFLLYFHLQNIYYIIAQIFLKYPIKNISFKKFLYYQYWQYEIKASKTIK